MTNSSIRTVFLPPKPTKTKAWKSSYSPWIICLPRAIRAVSLAGSNSLCFGTEGGFEYAEPEVPGTPAKGHFAWHTDCSDCTLSMCCAF